MGITISYKIIKNYQTQGASESASTLLENHQTQGASESASTLLENHQTQKICINFASWGYAVFVVDLLGHDRYDGLCCYLGNKKF